MVGVELEVSILFGLKITIEMKLNKLLEVIMENLNGVITCVWCGVAFLRAWLGHFQSK
jgi:hypothetical protein